MILEIFFPILYYLNVQLENKNSITIKENFVLFDSYITQDEVKDIKDKLEKQSLISEINRLFFMGKDKEAYLKLQKLKNYKYSEDFYYYFLAIYESKQNNFLQSRIYLKQALQKNPKMDFAWNLLGYLQMNSEDYTNAIYSFKNAIQLNPYHPVYHFNLANVYWLTNQKEEALKEINRCIELRDNLGDAYYLKALILKEENPQQTLENFKYALKRNFNNDKFYIDFFNLAIEFSDEESIVHLLEKTKNTKNIEIQIKRFQIYLQNGEYLNAYKEFISLMLNPSLKDYNFEEFSDILSRAKIFNCKFNKELEEFINKNKNLETFKKAFIIEILKNKCTIPIEVKDPIINPAL